jgi:hypothetical protein
MAFFSKTNSCGQMFAKNSSSMRKTPIVRRFLGENIFKIIKSVPDVILVM